MFFFSNIINETEVKYKTKPSSIITHHNLYWSPSKNQYVNVPEYNNLETKVFGSFDDIDMQFDYNTQLVDFDEHKTTEFYYYLDDATYYVPLIFVIIINFYYIFKLEGKVIPTNYNQDFIEILLLFLLKIYKAQMDVKGQYYFPDFFFCFLVLLLANYMSLVPYSLSPTSHMTLGLFIGLYLFILGFLNAYSLHQIKYLEVFTPPKSVPFPLGLFLSVIELISFLMRIPSLVVRLFANMLAGHLLLEILGSFEYDIIINGNFFLAFIFSLFFFLIILIKLFVSFLQAYILIYLSMIYYKEFYDGPAFKH